MQESYFSTKIQKYLESKKSFLDSYALGCILLKHMFEFDQFLIEEQLIIEKNFYKIFKNPVGRKLIYCLMDQLNDYTESLYKEIVEKECVDENDSHILNFLKSYKLEKILVIKGRHTCFAPPKSIRSCYQFSWSSNENWKNFKIKIEIGSVSDSLISVISKNTCDSNPNNITPFFMIVVHELIHAVHYLNSPITFLREHREMKSHHFYLAVNTY